MLKLQTIDTKLYMYFVNLRTCFSVILSDNAIEYIYITERTNKVIFRFLKTLKKMHKNSMKWSKIHWLTKVVIIRQYQIYWILKRN